MTQKKALSFRQKLQFESFRLFRKSEAKAHPLKYLFWECTLRCNLSCLHCGSDCHTSSSLEDMPAEDFLSEMKHLSTIYNPQEIMVVITGGEPLLRKDLPDIGMKLRKLGFRWGIVTNGLGLDQEILNLLINSGMGAITLSIDGLEGDHNWQRNNPMAYQKAVSALELICSYPRLEADVVTCVNQRNINDLNTIYKQLSDKGLKTWRLFTITPIGRAKNYPELELTKNQFSTMIDFIVKKKETNSQLNVNFSCESYLGSMDDKVRDGLFFCRAGIHIASILADGSVSACPNIDHGFIQGNIYDKHLDEIWENNFKPFRNRSWTKKGQCTDCKEYKYCEGSGMHWWHGTDPQLLKCHNNQL